MKSVTELLDQISEYQAMVDVIALDQQAAMEKVLTAEINAQLEAIAVEFDGKTEAARAKIAELTEEVKLRTLQEGASVKGAHLQAVFVKGRETWDGKLLAGFAIAHPEIERARKIGEPSVTLRKI